MTLKRNGNLLSILIVIGAVGGGICGWVFGPRMEPIAFLGDLFLDALRMVVVPLLILSIIAGVTALGDVRKIGGIGWKTLVYYLATTSIAVVIGLILVNIIEPGVGAKAAAGAGEIGVQSASLQSLVGSLVHPSLFEAMAKPKFLPLIIFSLIFGGALTTLGAKGKRVIDAIGTLNEAMLTVVRLVLWLAPIGIFSLVATRLGATGGGDAFVAEVARVGKYTATVVTGLIIHGAIVLPLILYFFGHRRPLKYAWGVIEALITAFSTASSSATLPVTLRDTTKRNKVPAASADFVLPIGATVNMDGTALYEAVAAMFIAQSYGISLTIEQQAIIFLTAVLASIGAAGIPEAGLITIVIVLQSVGLPIEGIGIILAIDWFIDRCRTTVNVWGDTVGAAVIAETSEIRNRQTP
jgi:Na+/H+-dicarboxylate symporter